MGVNIKVMRAKQKFIALSTLGNTQIAMSQLHRRSVSGGDLTAGAEGASTNDGGVNARVVGDGGAESSAPRCGGGDGAPVVEPPGGTVQPLAPEGPDMANDGTVRLPPLPSRLSTLSASPPPTELAEASVSTSACA